MKFTLSWLRDHLDTEAGVDEIARTLNAIGLEVEGIEIGAAEVGVIEGGGGQVDVVEPGSAQVCAAWAVIVAANG